MGLLGNHRCSVSCTRGFAQAEGENVNRVGISPLVLGGNRHVLGCEPSGTPRGTSQSWWGGAGARPF